MRESDTNRSEQTNDQAVPPVSIRGIALDMDGLLFDTEGLYWQVGDIVLQRRGYRFCAELQERMMGRIGVDSAQQMIDFFSLSDSPQALLDEADVLYGALLRDGLKPMPGLSEWIELLQQSGLPFGLATSSRRKWVDVIFERVSWSASLAFTLTGDDVVNGKPHPEMYSKAAAALEIDAGQMLVLEDSGNGCAAAVAAGAIVVAIPSEHTIGQSFEGAALVADSLLDSRLTGLIRKTVD
jgi:HAD superfamily hydrolase (TIGR01509 family)